MQHQTQMPDVEREEWGNGMVVISPQEGSEPGEWIMYSPEDSVPLDESR